MDNQVCPYIYVCRGEPVCSPCEIIYLNVYINGMVGCSEASTHPTFALIRLILFKNSRHYQNFLLLFIIYD